jgi:2,3-dihydroxybiphenyl 1,2-dioxygenase
MQLGFLCFEVRDLSTWDKFLTQTLGLVAVGSGRYRMDGHAWRFQLTEGPLDDLSAVGWELTDAELDDRLAALAAAGIEATEADPAARSAARRFTCVDPSGIPVELLTGLARASEPFKSPVVQGGFVADELGLGHLVLSAPDPAASERFYADLLGFKLSDRIQTSFYGHDVDLGFYHINPRHHSLAFGGPQRKRINHFLLEARHMDEVGLAYDRCIRGGARIMLTLGRHPNDRMFSFYALTPSRFQVEFGWGGRQVDPEAWQSGIYTQISEWGHHPPQAAFPPPRRK